MTVFSFPSKVFLQTPSEFLDLLGESMRYFCSAMFEMTRDTVVRTESPQGIRLISQSTLNVLSVSVKFLSFSLKFRFNAILLNTTVAHYLLKRF